MVKKIICIMPLMFLTGCLLILDNDCKISDDDYWYTDYDCYDQREMVEVCSRHECWSEYRYRRVCDEYYICHDRDDRRNR